jgi:hypothetical protein
MTRLELGALISRVIALYWFMFSLHYISAIFSFLVSSKLALAYTFLMQTAFAFLIQAVPALFMWCRADLVGRWIVGANRENREAAVFSKISFEDGMRFIFVFVGLYVLFKGIPHYASLLENVIACMNGCERGGFAYSTFYHCIIYIVMGIGLILGRDGFERKIREVREKGVDVKPQDNDK